MERTILHCDCNGFYASVECVLKPELKNIPMAVGGNPENRHGIILAKNELAKKYNIQTAETIYQAKQKCPDLVVVPPHHAIYKEYSQNINNIYKRYTDLVEPFGIDESWLDVTSCRMLFGNGKDIADKIRYEVKKELGLTVSVGVSFNKIFAKLGSDYKKPDATTVFSKNNWKQLIFPLPVKDLMYVGKSTAVILRDLGIKTIGQLARADAAMLEKRLGKIGRTLYMYANGLDDSPVKSIYDNKEIQSVGNGMTFSKDLEGEEEIRTEIYSLADNVAMRLRKNSLKCCTVQVHIKTPEFKTISRQKKLYKPACTAKEIADAAMELMIKYWDMTKPIRMITVTGANVVDESDVFEQISIFDEKNENTKKRTNLEKTMDTLRNKFGKSVINFGYNHNN